MARTVNKKEHAQRRARIVAAAAEEFAANGFDGTSTNAICARAKIGSGTLFHYFASKQEVFTAIFADDRPRTTALCEDARGQADVDDGIDIILRDLIAGLADPLAPGLAAAAVIQAGRDADFAAVLAESDGIVNAALTDLLHRVAEERSLPLSPESTASWIRALVDAGHLGMVPGDRSAKDAELWSIITWLLGRSRPPLG